MRAEAHGNTTVLADSYPNGASVKNSAPSTAGSPLAA